MKMASGKKLTRGKAQMETMGLLIIVILVTLVLFFVLTFSLKPKPDEDTGSFAREQAMSNFGPTILESTVKCSMEGRIRTMRELLSDCGYEHEIRCNGLDSCTAANQTIVEILSLTLDKWEYTYTMTIDKGDIVVLPIALNCTSSKSSTFEETPFGTTHGPMTLRIRTC